MKWDELLGKLFSLHNTNAFRVSKEIGISNRTLSNILNGTTSKVSSKIKEGLERHFNIQIDDSTPEDVNYRPNEANPFLTIYDNLSYDGGEFIGHEAGRIRFGEGGLFGVVVKDSVMSPAIQVGDIAVLDQGQTFVDGDICFVFVADSVTLLRRCYSIDNERVIMLCDSIRVQSQAMKTTNLKIVPIVQILRNREVLRK